MSCYLVSQNYWAWTLTFTIGTRWLDQDCFLVQGFVQPSYRLLVFLRRESYHCILDSRTTAMVTRHSRSTPPMQDLQKSAIRCLEVGHFVRNSSQLLSARPEQFPRQFAKSWAIKGLEFFAQELGLQFSLNLWIWIWACYSLLLVSRNLCQVLLLPAPI